MVLFWLRGAFSTSLDEVEVREATTIGASERVH
jgi:hypothetical protein